MAAVLNTYRPGCARAVSGETDDDEREELLAGVRAGEFQFLFNCDVLDRGLRRADLRVRRDDPTDEVAAAATSSARARAAAARRHARGVARNGKRDCLILDFTGTAGKHALIGPADCLRAPNETSPTTSAPRSSASSSRAAARSPRSWSTRSRRGRAAARAMRIQTRRPLPQPSTSTRSSAPRTAARCRRARSAWEHEPPTERQLEALEKLGVTLSKLPKGFSRCRCVAAARAPEARVGAGCAATRRPSGSRRLGVRNTALSRTTARRSCSTSCARGVAAERDRERARGAWREVEVARDHPRAAHARPRHAARHRRADARGVRRDPRSRSGVAPEVERAHPREAESSPRRWTRGVEWFPGAPLPNRLLTDRRCRPTTEDGELVHCNPPNDADGSLAEFFWRTNVEYWMRGWARAVFYVGFNVEQLARNQRIGARSSPLRHPTIVPASGRATSTAKRCSRRRSRCTRRSSRCSRTSRGRSKPSRRWAGSSATSSTATSPTHTGDPNDHEPSRSTRTKT
jgi:hypothetical protein